MAIQSQTGYTENTPKHYLIDAAVVYKNVTYAEVGGFTGSLVGATQGGVSVNIEQEYRHPEVDGTAVVDGKIEGNVILQRAAASAVINLKEITAANLGLSLNSAPVDAGANEAPTGYKKITTKRKVAAGDYLTNLAIVGTISGSTQPIVAILDKALCKGGVEIGTTESGETVLELTFEANATVAQLAAEEFPWRIYYPPIA